MEVLSVCTRSTAYLHQAVKEFSNLGISFVSLTQNIDTTTATGKLVFTILGAVAEMERDLIRERIKAGPVNARVGTNENAGADFFSVRTGSRAGNADLNGS